MILRGLNEQNFADKYEDFYCMDEILEVELNSGEERYGLRFYIGYFRKE